RETTLFSCHEIREILDFSSEQRNREAAFWLAYLLDRGYKEGSGTAEVRSTGGNGGLEAGWRLS
ncbi:MAG: hypothetical protein ACREQ3_10560, partial [Candidatus Binatia bacterium]